MRAIGVPVGAQAMMEGTRNQVGAHAMNPIGAAHAMDSVSAQARQGIRNSVGVQAMDLVRAPENNGEPNIDRLPLHHLRRFGCIAYKLIPKDLRVDNKMGARAKRCMMTGYVRNATGIWRLWDMESKRIIECSDVKFDEDSTAYTEDSCNEGDPLGLPPEKPIYEEVQVEGPITREVAPDEVTTSKPDKVAAAMSDPKGTHKQKKAAMSDPNGTHKQKKAETHTLPEKAMRGTTETHALPEKAMSGTSDTKSQELEKAAENTDVAVHSLALVFVEESGVIGVVSALLAFFFGRLVLFLLSFT